MLTNEALHERKWGQYPSVGVLLGQHPIPDHYYGRPSISDNVFSWLNRVAEVAVTTKEHAALLRETNDPQLIQRLPEDLRALEHELQAAARFFGDHAEVVRSLAREAYQREERQRKKEHKRSNNDSERSA